MGRKIDQPPIQQTKKSGAGGGPLSAAENDVDLKNGTYSSTIGANASFQRRELVEKSTNAEISRFCRFEWRNERTMEPLLVPKKEKGEQMTWGRVRKI